MELQALLVQFAQVNGLTYEEALQMANRFIEGGFNEFVGYGIDVSGDNAIEREENLRAALEEKLMAQ